MPALKNPRHEAFAQAIFGGIVNARGGAHSQAEAYRRAGYNVTNGNSAKACASRLLTFANGIGERIRELQAIAADQAVESAEKMARELNEIQHEARADKAHAAAVSAVMGKAKILNFITDNVQVSNTIDFNSAQSVQEIGRKLLQSIGFNEPDDISIASALEANDQFIAQLQTIHRQAQGLTIEQRDE
jgi:hypothetical protein